MTLSYYAAISVQLGVCVVLILLQSSAQKCGSWEVFTVIQIIGLPTEATAETPEITSIISTSVDPTAVAAETPEGINTISLFTVGDPTAVAAETPVIAIGNASFQAPWFHVPLFHPDTATSVVAVPPIPE